MEFSEVTAEYSIKCLSCGEWASKKAWCVVEDGPHQDLSKKPFVKCPSCENRISVAAREWQSFDTCPF